MIRDLGRIPAERDTNYTLIQVFDDGPDTASPLDVMRENEEHAKSGRRQAASSGFSPSQSSGEESRWTSH
jgi:hypothetical protein